MSAGPQAALLPDGRRLHLHHGPIDLIIDVDVDADLRAAAHARAIRRFSGLLGDLVRDLPALRRPLDATPLVDPVARRMARAVAPFAPLFVTPMAAVAGAVADEMLVALVADAPIAKAWVNNGGDIAFHLAAGQEMTALGPSGAIRVPAASPSRGLATSGWRGRSLSLGIADAVTVCAATAAEADVAATLIANVVDLPGHPAIRRVPACDLVPDSDLGDRPVTTGVGPLSLAETRRALQGGLAFARDLVARGLIHDAVLCLNGERLSTAQTEESVPLHA
ncbi:MAG: UPF0280 family protein [Rhodobacteraceae bacterium]|nr:MAG: UPF0280 family protein [Paracoccaceae bacterium]